MPCGTPPKRQNQRIFRNLPHARRGPQTRVKFLTHSWAKLLQAALFQGETVSTTGLFTPYPQKLCESTHTLTAPGQRAKDSAPYGEQQTGQKAQSAARQEPSAEQAHARLHENGTAQSSGSHRRRLTSDERDRRRCNPRNRPCRLQERNQAPHRLSTYLPPLPANSVTLLCIDARSHGGAIYLPRVTRSVTRVSMTTLSPRRRPRVFIMGA